MSIFRPVYTKCLYCGELIRRHVMEEHPRACPRRVEFLAAELAWTAAHDPNDYDRIVQRNPILLLEQDPA